MKNKKENKLNHRYEIENGKGLKWKKKSNLGPSVIFPKWENHFFLPLWAQLWLPLSLLVLLLTSDGSLRKWKAQKFSFFHPYCTLFSIRFSHLMVFSSFSQFGVVLENLRAGFVVRKTRKKRGCMGIARVQPRGWEHEACLDFVQLSLFLTVLSLSLV